MKKETPFDQLMRQGMQEIVKGKEPYLIYESVQHKLQQERKSTMKINRKLKVSIVSICCIMLLGITGFAIGKATGYFSSSYFAGNKIPTEKQWVQNLGSIPMFVEEFSNGYTFESYYKGDTSRVDENNNPLETVSTLTLDYQDKVQNRNGISFNIQPQWKQETEDKADKTELIEGIQINIYEMDNKFVPPSYKLTEEDTELQDKGLLNIAYGSDTIEENHSTLLTWKKDNLSYSLIYTGQKEVTDTELLNMTKEIIHN